MVSTSVDLDLTGPKRITITKHPWSSSDFRSYQAYRRALKALIQASPTLHAHYEAWCDEPYPLDNMDEAPIKAEKATTRSESLSEQVTHEDYVEFQTVDAKLYQLVRASGIIFDDDAGHADEVEALFSDEQRGVELIKWIER